MGVLPALWVLSGGVDLLWGLDQHLHLALEVCSSTHICESGCVTGKRILAGAEHFMRAVDYEFSKFERKERESRLAELEERTAKLRPPIAQAV